MKNEEKNVATSKAPQGTFDGTTKEPFSTRLRQLQGARSLYKTAKDWEISLSTLKNYFTRQNSVPRREVLTRISEREGVSIEWLLYGSSDSVEPVKQSEPALGNSDDMQLEPEIFQLVKMLSLLSKEDVKNLEKTLMLKGVETLLYLLDEDNIELMRQDPVVKAKILGKQVDPTQEVSPNDQEKRERASDGELQTTEHNLANHVKKKQAR
ncbi:hypothetical protein ACWKX9_05765 [Enterobacter asburiae]